MTARWEVFVSPEATAVLRDVSRTASAEIAKRLDEFADIGRFFFTDSIEYDQAAVRKYLQGPDIKAALGAVDGAFALLPSFDAGSLEQALRLVADEFNVKAATLIHAVRVAITGKMVSPGLFDVLSLLGRERTHARIGAALQKISVPEP